jgi:hypothetical protein
MCVGRNVDCVVAESGGRIRVFARGTNQVRRQRVFRVLALRQVGDGAQIEEAEPLEAMPPEVLAALRKRVGPDVVREMVLA